MGFGAPNGATGKDQDKDKGLVETVEVSLAAEDKNNAEKKHE